jgi:hypothetical protein
VQARRDEDAVRPTLEQPSQIGLAQGQGQTAQIFTVERQDVEGVQLHSSSCRRECSALKSGMPSTPSTTASPSMTMPDTVLQRGFDDPRIAVGPVVAASGDEAHAVAVTLQAEPVTVVFHFMEPVGTVRNVGRLGRKTKLKHSLKVGAVTANCESGAGCGRPPPGVGHVRRGRQVDGASSWNNTLVSLRPCAVTLARRGLLVCEKNVRQCCKVSRTIPPTVLIIRGLEDLSFRGKQRRPRSYCRSGGVAFVARVNSSKDACSKPLPLRLEKLSQPSRIRAALVPCRMA